MLHSVSILTALLVASLLAGLAVGDRFIDINEEPIFDSNNMLLHLHVEKRFLSVQLEEHPLPDAPVFTMREDGGLDRHHASNDHPPVRFFKDSRGRGNFMLHQDESGNHQMRGFVKDGSEHVVLKPAPAEERRRRDTGNWHVISRREQKQPDGVDDFVLPSDEVMKSYRASMNKPYGPRTRAGSVDRYVELLLFTDSEIYEEHRRALGTSDNIKITQSIKFYFTQIIASMDDRFRMSFLNDADLRISIKLVGYVISSKRGESPWTEGASVQISGTPVDSDGRKTVQGDAGLDVFRKWLMENTVPVAYDYALFFTGRNIGTPKAGFNVLGIAPVAGICTTFATGAAEDFLAFESAGVATHELGHNLGSYHDGDSISSDAAKCPATDKYLMAPVTQSDVHQYTFSACSKVQIKKLLIDRTCLQNTASNDPFAASVANKYVPGEVYSIQQRCKAMFGPKSVPISYDLVASNGINVCLQLSCFTDPQTGSYMTQSSIAPNGTPCGDGTWCVQGKCVADASAPKGTCYMGDVSTGDNSGFYSSCANAVAPLLRVFGKTTTDELCVAVPAFKKDCCRTCKVAGGFSQISASDFILGTGLPTDGSTTAVPTTTVTITTPPTTTAKTTAAATTTVKTTAAATTTAKTTAAATTTVVITTTKPSTATTKTATTTGVCGQDQLDLCSRMIPYCFKEFYAYFRDQEMGLVEDACPKSCGKC